MMKRDTFELIQALEGSIEPCTETNIDIEHLANLKAWCVLHERITDEIAKVANNCDLRSYKSAKDIIDFARQHLEQVNSYVEEYIQNWKGEERSSEEDVMKEHNVPHPVMELTINEVLDRLEYNTSQLEMELKSGLWIKGSDSEKFCQEGIVYNNQLKSWLIELKNARRLIKSTSDNCMLTWNDTTLDYEWSLKEEACSLINMEDVEND